MGVEAPPRAQWIRTILFELSPHREHLAVPRRHGRPARRAHAGLLRVPRPRVRAQPDRGGDRRAFPSELRPHRRPEGRPAEGLDRRDPQGHGARSATFCDEIEDLLIGNEIFQARTRGIGVIPARSPSPTASRARTSGRAASTGTCDATSAPGLAYDKVDWKVWTHPDGDSFARYWIRMQEVRESTRIVDQLLDTLPNGPVMAKVPAHHQGARGRGVGRHREPARRDGLLRREQGRPRARSGSRSVRLRSTTSRSCRGCYAGCSCPTSSRSLPACTSSSGTSTGDVAVRWPPSSTSTGSRPSSGSLGVLVAVLIPAGTIVVPLPVQGDVLHAEPHRARRRRARTACCSSSPTAGSSCRRRTCFPSGPTAGLQGGADRRAGHHVPRLRRHPVRAHLVFADVDVGIFFVLAVSSVSVHRHLDGGLGLGQQVLAHGWPPGRRPADRLRAADGARGRRRRHPGRHAEPAAASSSRRTTGRSSASTSSATRSSSRSSSASRCSSIAAQAELTQTPFDMPVAESELVSGYQTEYTRLSLPLLLHRRVRDGVRLRGARVDAVPRRLGPAVDRARQQRDDCSGRSCCSPR